MSGIKVTPEMTKEFAEARESANVLFLQYSINDSGFVKIGSGNVTHSAESDFSALQNALNEQHASLAVFRSSGQASKWLVVFYVPDKCPVRERMVFSSSLNAFRDGLGSQYLVSGSFNVARKSDCTFSSYQHGSAVVDTNDLLTIEEKLKREGEASSRLMMSETKVAAIVDMPIAITDRAQAALANAKNRSSRSFVLALLKEDEKLDVALSGNQSLQQLATTLPVLLSSFFP